MWWAPQEGGHSGVFWGWGLACEGFIAGEQGRGWGNSYKRYGRSLSCEQKTHTLHFLPLAQNVEMRLMSFDPSCLWCNWAITLVYLYTHKQTIPRSNLVIFWINLIIFWEMTSGWAEPCLTNACYSSLTVKKASMTTSTTVDFWSIIQPIPRDCISGALLNVDMTKADKDQFCSICSWAIFLQTLTCLQ